MPPYVIAANGPVALRFLAQMKAGSPLPRAVVLNEPRKQRQVADLRTWCASHDIPVHDWSPDIGPLIQDVLRSDPRMWLLSIYFGHVLSRDLLAAVGGRAVNLHPSLL